MQRWKLPALHYTLPHTCNTASGARNRQSGNRIISLVESGFTSSTAAGRRCIFAPLALMSGAGFLFVVDLVLPGWYCGYDRPLNCLCCVHTRVAYIKNTLTDNHASKNRRTKEQKKVERHRHIA